MIAMPSGLVAMACVNWVVILAGSQSDQTYCTSAPVSAAAARAPLYTTVSKPPPGAPPGKKTIFVPEHQPVPAAGAPPSVLVGAAGAWVTASVGAVVAAGAHAVSTTASRTIITTL